MSKNITEQSVFGTYFQTENQVTSALLKILETDCGGGSLLDEILQRIDEGNGLPEKTLKIETQSHIDDTDIHSIPDGLISCNYAFNIYIESKLSDVINLTQLENHKKLIVENASISKNISIFLKFSPKITILYKVSPKQSNYDRERKEETGNVRTAIC